MLLRGILEGSSWHLGGFLELLGGLLGASWGPLGGLLGLLGGTSGASRGLLGSSWGERLELSVRIRPLGPLLGSTSVSLGPSWGPLGPSWGHLELSWGSPGGLMARLGTVLGALLAVLDAAKTKEASMLKMYVFRREFGNFCFLGLSRRFSGSFLGQSWGPRGPSRSHLGSSWGYPGPSGRSLGLSWRSPWTFLGHLGALWRLRWPRGCV